MRLSREIRFALVPPDQDLTGKPQNSWAGWPATNRIVPRLVLRCEIEGEIDPATGFLCNITLVDKHLREIVTRSLIPNANEIQTAEDLLLVVFDEMKSSWSHSSKITRLELAVSPYLNFSISDSSFQEDPSFEKSTNTGAEMSQKITLTEQFEFSAAHRLHCEELSESENQATFGKCNNLEGHGHNYVVEVSVSRCVGSTESGSQRESDQVINLAELESTVKRLVIDRLDHKHLNRDIEHFSNLNPTVENISVAIFDWLDGQFGDAKLDKIRLYETPKTWAEYRGR